MPSEFDNVVPFPQRKMVETSPAASSMAQLRIITTSTERADDNLRTVKTATRRMEAATSDIHELGQNVLDVAALLTELAARVRTLSQSCWTEAE